MEGRPTLTHFLSQSAVAAAAAARAGEIFLPGHHRLLETQRRLQQQQHPHAAHPHHPALSSHGRGAAAAAAAASAQPPHTYVSVGGDKRNRNPNWTDGEIVRFLEILQEESVMRDLLAQRNKQVFCYVAQRLGAEGADKTWDQCRIKLKNLKSQYRYVKERIPEVATMNLEEEDSMKRLVTECQSRGISPSSLKHLKFLRRFLAKVNQVRMQQPLSDLASANAASSLQHRLGGDPLATGAANTDSSTSFGEASENVEVTVDVNLAHKEEDCEESVSPPPTSVDIKTRDLSIVEEEDEGNRKRSRYWADALSSGRQDAKRRRTDHALSSPCSPPRQPLSPAAAPRETWCDVQLMLDGLQRDLTERFLEHQRRAQTAMHHWELERRRQEEMMAERWRREAREHEARMFGMFARMVGECSATMAAVVRVAAQQQQQHETHPRTAATIAAPRQNGVENGGEEEDEDVDDEEEEGAEEEEEDQRRNGGRESL